MRRRYACNHLALSVRIQPQKTYKAHALKEAEYSASFSKGVPGSKAAPAPRDPPPTLLRFVAAPAPAAAAAAAAATAVVAPTNSLSPTNSLARSLSLSPPRHPQAPPLNLPQEAPPPAFGRRAMAN
jgi:hypothetical protein